MADQSPKSEPVAKGERRGMLSAIAKLFSRKKKAVKKPQRRPQRRLGGEQLEGREVF